MDKITITILIIGGILLFIMLMYFGLAIVDSHNICNAMNLTGCGK